MRGSSSRGALSERVPASPGNLWAGFANYGLDGSVKMLEKYGEKKMKIRLLAAVGLAIVLLADVFPREAALGESLLAKPSARRRSLYQGFPTVLQVRLFAPRPLADEPVNTLHKFPRTCD